MTDTRLKIHWNYIVLCIVIFLVVTCSAVYFGVLVYQDIQRPDTPKQSNQICLKCQTLSTIVDRRAWTHVTEDMYTETCCFNTDTVLARTLKNYFEKRYSSSLSETELYTLVSNQLLTNNANATSRTPYTHPDLSTLVDLIYSGFTTKRSVLHLASLDIVTAEGSSLKISWIETVQHGHIFLSNDTCSVNVMHTGLYFIYIQVKFRASVFNSQTMSVSGKFYLAARREGHLIHIDDYIKRYVFREENTEQNANLHSVFRLETGDTLIIRFPSSQKSYLASDRSAHRLTIFELS